MKELETDPAYPMVRGLRPDDVFYDLGSGRGLVPATAFTSNGVKRAYGVEFAAHRGSTGCQLLNNIYTYPDMVFGRAEGELNLLEGDFLQQNMDDATVVYMCATCFRAVMQQALVQKFVEIATRTKKPLMMISVSTDFQAVHRFGDKVNYPGAAGEIEELSPEAYKEIFPHESHIIPVNCTWGADQKVLISKLYPLKNPEVLKTIFPEGDAYTKILDPNIPKRRCSLTKTGPRRGTGKLEFQSWAIDGLTDDVNKTYQMAIPVGPLILPRRHK